VLGGTTLPMLKHDNCFALLSCIFNAVSLEVYLDAENKSFGELYLDDGESLDYEQENKAAHVEFSFDGTTLKTQVLLGSDYEAPSS